MYNLVEALDDAAQHTRPAVGPAPLDVEQAVAACRRSIGAKLY